MRVINIVDELSNVNFGIWNSAISTAEELLAENIDSEIWAFGNIPLPTGINIPCRLIKDEGLKKFAEMAKSLDPGTDVIVTHGCWRCPTKWGYWFAKQGFVWVYTPHGMLEPWALQQKKIKKKIYLELFEKRWSRYAAAIRAVSSSEATNLRSVFPSSKVIHISNGVDGLATGTSDRQWKQFLFLSRLHKKKGIMPFVTGWINSTFAHNPNVRLVIAGPDQGELIRLEKLIQNCENIIYVGPVYGKAKEELLRSSDFFLLTSFSEGFPTAVLEAMELGLIPVMSKGCNFNEAFDAKAAFHAEPDSTQISQVLDKLSQMSKNELDQMSANAIELILSSFTLKTIALQQIALFNSLSLENSKKNNN
jgi:glycosyltransferase involved in cell wall biosynthesis